MKALSLCVLVLCVAALAAAVESAQACSCAIPDPRSALAAADGAFVGNMVSRRETAGSAILTFEVERALKGSLGKRVEVVTARDSAGCGLEMPIGTRTGLVLDRSDGAWQGGLCTQFSPADLLAAVKPLPAPNGKGPVALIVGGRFGPARLLALDARGRTLAYGMGGGTVSTLSLCPGGRRLAEIVQVGANTVVAIRELRTMRLVRRQSLAATYFGQASCLDASGTRLAVFRASDADLTKRARVLRVGPKGTTTLWRGFAWNASFTHRTGYIASPGGTLHAVDLRTGVAKKLGEVRYPAYELVPNESGTQLAGSSYDESQGCCPRLLVVDLTRRPIATRAIPLPTDVGHAPIWLADGGLAYASGSGMRVYDKRLRLLVRNPDWSTNGTAIVGTQAFGIGTNGRLLQMQLPFGSVRVVRRLPSPTAQVIVAVR